MMKVLKLALCSGVALATFTTVTFANDLSTLKILFSELNSAKAISQAGILLPRGFSVDPTADVAADEAPAVEEPFVEVKTSGYIKGGFIFSDIRDGSPADKSNDIDVEAGVNFKGSVQSSLGEVGTTIQLKWDVAESTTNVSSIALRDDGIVGFWQFADTMKLEMGRGNAGRLENGIVKNTRRIWTTADRRVRAENAGSGFFDRDMYNGFLGLAYSSGPLSLSVRAHDATRGVTGAAGSDDDALGASAKGLFTSDMINLEMVGGYWGQSNAKNLALASQTGVKWLAGIGSELNFIPGVPVSVGVQTGQLHNGAEQFNASASIGFTLTDNISAGIGAGWKKVKKSPASADNRTERVINGGIYYAPMAYLTLGVEGDWLDDSKPAATTNDGFTGAFVTRYSF
jgi:hypothetical protein